MCLDNLLVGARPGKGTNGAARQVDVCEPSSQRAIFAPLAGNGLKVVDKRSDLAFAGV
jgi:hypothetical protein